MKQQVYIFPGSDHVFRTLWDDARGAEDLRIIDSLFLDASIESKILYFKRKNKVLWKLFGQRILRCYLKNINALESIDRDSIVVFSNISVRFLPVSFLQKMRTQGIKLVVYFIDSISNINAKEAFNYVKLGLFDAVYSFDKEDSKRYGFIHFYTMYSRHYAFTKKSSILYDAVYIGSDKGRYRMLTSLKNKCPNSRFYVNMLNISEDQMRSSGFQSNKSILYRDSLEIVQKANCIIDLVLDPKQSGLSLRVYEAISFQKKLVTNNPSIFDFPFYNPKFMLYIKNIEDIDEKFIKEKLQVDYGYKDEFSPMEFVKNIRKKIR